MHMHQGVNRYAMRQPTGKPREPLRTLQELADEFGLASVYCLSQQMRRSPVTPPTRMLTTPAGAGGSAKAWYSPTAMRRWWAAHNAAIQGGSP